MGKLTNAGYAKLDQLLEEYGSDWLMKSLVTRVADGDSPEDMARSLGMPYVVLKSWMEEHCAEEVALALRARADILEHRATTAVDGADPDSVQVVRLQADHYMKVAGKLDRARYGEKVVVENTVSVDLLSAIHAAERRVLESRMPVVIDAEVVVVGEAI